MSSLTRTLFAAAVLAAGLASAAAAQAPLSKPVPSPQPKNDYADAKTWLCRPGRNDACAINLDSTVIKADGTRTIEVFKADPAPAIDCFYVYPTVSNDPGGNSDMIANREETFVAKQQFARFAAVCRPYAPLYRQVTITALKAAIAGVPMAADRALAYGDVKDAWDHYLAHDNGGRGVVLIGHSQGSGVLIELVKREIDGKPVQKKIVAVILGGARLQVPDGKDVGGDFKAIPLCHSASQTGCAINFASFRETSPPPANSRFGISSGPGLKAACSNPAALGGGSGELKTYLPSGAEAIVADSSPARAWTKEAGDAAGDGAKITTPFVSVPGMLSAQCRENATATYLSIAIHAEPTDVRASDIAGDVQFGRIVLKDWGLHLIDMNLAMGNLIDTVRAERAVWVKAHP